MAEPGQTFNLHDHERVTVRTAAEQSHGALLELEVEWSPGERRPPGHLHPEQAEHFEIAEGEVTAEVGRQTRVLRAGDTLDVPRGTVHRMWNASDGPARGSWQVRPALRTEDMFQAIHELHAAGRTGSGGTMTPLGAGVVLSAFPREFRLALPVAVQRPLLRLLGAVGRLRGYPPV